MLQCHDEQYKTTILACRGNQGFIYSYDQLGLGTMLVDHVLYP